MKDNNDLIFIELDRPRKLWCGHKALKTMTAMLGKSISELDMEHFNPDDIEVIMYALMQKDAAEHGEVLDVEGIADLLDNVKYSDVIKAMAQAIEAAFSDGSAKNAERAAVKNGIGENP